MSSLQKFHRRTASFGPPDPFPTIGSGNDAVGYWVWGTAPKMIVAPRSTEGNGAFSTANILSGANSTTNGLANTNTLASLGTAVYPVPGRCKYLTTGGYNTWYLPAREELISLVSNKSVTPFSISNGLNGNNNDYFMSSTESGSSAYVVVGTGGSYSGISTRQKISSSTLYRAIRQV